MEQGNTSINRSRNPLSAKKLILMCGYPGAGKTTLARYINRNLNGRCCIIHRDSLRNLLQGKGLVYSNHSSEGKAIDEELLARVEKQISKYDIIILDATFRAQIKRQMIYEFARKNHYEVIVVHCACSIETAYKRLEHQIFYEESKPYINPIELILDYSQKQFHEPKNDLDSTATTIIKVDTEKGQIESFAPKDKFSDFASQLIWILETFPFFETTNHSDLHQMPEYYLM